MVEFTMETFVSDLLENADLGVITKKDVRMKYKSFIGRDISPEEKAKINDLVYAFVYYYAAKLKKSAERKDGQTDLSMVDKENKQKHVKEKGTKENGSRKSSSPNKTLPFKGQVSDKHNIKNLTKKKSSSDTENKDENEFKERDKMLRRNRADRKSYPIRKRKESTWLQLADAVSAIMASDSNSDDTGTDSSDDSDSEPERDEAEKEALQQAVKKLQKEREIRIQLAVARKKMKLVSAAIMAKGSELEVINTKKEIKVENNSDPIVVSSEDSVILLSDFDSKNDSKTVSCGKKSIKISKGSDSDKKKKDKISEVKRKKVFKGSQSDDSVKFKVKKTSGNYSKKKKDVKDKVLDKKNKSQKIVLIETETESESDKTAKKKSTFSKGSQGKKLTTLAQLRKKILEAKEIKKLVKKKREVAKLKKLNKEKRQNHVEIKPGKHLEISMDALNCDNSKVSPAQLSDVNSMGSEIEFGKSPVLIETDSSSDFVSSEVSERLKDTDSLTSLDSDVVGCVSSPVTHNTDTDSPLKVTPSQLAKKKRRQLESDDENVKNVPKKPKPALKKQFGNEKSDSKSESDDGFLTLNDRANGHMNKNGVLIVSADSSSDEDEPLSQTKAKLWQKKQTSEEPEPHLLYQLRKICRSSGIFVRSDRELKDCSTNSEKIAALKQVLKDAGMKGQPSMKKAEELKLQKEAAELSTENIISSTETATGRARRNVRSIYARPMVLSSDTDSPETSRRGALFEKLMELRDSETSE